MLTLFHMPRIRSVRVLGLLEELGLPHGSLSESGS